MRIVPIDSVYSRITEATQEEILFSRAYLMFSDNTAKWSGAPPKQSLLQMNGTFPSGVLPMLERALPEHGFDAPDVTRTPAPLTHNPNADLTWLRDYQKEALDAMVAKERGILHMPTGSGKSELVVAATRVWEGKWLFIVHRSNLVYQTASRYALRSPGLTAGCIADGEWNVPADASLIASTFQTLMRGVKTGNRKILAILRGAQGIIVDECHVAAANMCRAVLAETIRAHYRFGLSGTPLARGDKKSLLAISMLGSIIYRVKPERLIEAGVMSKPAIRMVQCVQDLMADSWPNVYRAGVVRSAARNALLIEATVQTEKPAFVFVKDVSHGRSLVKGLERAGLHVRFVWGKVPVEMRDTACRDLAAGRLDVLVCSVVFQEGVDVPDLRSVVIASGGHSVIAALQRIGRGARVAAGKNAFEVWDVADVGNRMLERHSAARMAAYRSEGFDVGEVARVADVKKVPPNSPALPGM